MNQVIEIETCRVARRDGGLFLDMIINIPPLPNDGLTSLQITNLITDKRYELINAVHQQFAELYGRLPMSIPLHNLNEVGSSVYEISVKCGNLEEHMYVSDVEFVYDYIIKGLDLSDNKCSILSDDLILAYSLLYGHTLAMIYKDATQAVYLFNKLLQLTNTCSGINLTCNCND